MPSAFSPQPTERGAMSVSDFCSWAGISRTHFYRLVHSGQIKARKIGAKTVVTQPDAQAWLSSLPVAIIPEAA
jgi:excisionase family DNA binding protein